MAILFYSFKVLLEQFWDFLIFFPCNTKNNSKNFEDNDVGGGGVIREKMKVFINA